MRLNDNQRENLGIFLVVSVFVIGCISVFAGLIMTINLIQGYGDDKFIECMTIESQPQLTCSTKYTERYRSWQRTQERENN